MEQIVKVLHQIAAEGSIPSLLDLLNKDRFILDRCMAISYGETPLHIGVMFGHLEFCTELLKRKPELAGELDFRRSSALHLASAKGFTDIVKILVSVSPKMSFAYDEDGKIPIHVAAMKGRVEVLKELVEIQPDAVHKRVEMCQGETVLHLCVQYSQLEALTFLVENINDEQLLNAKDDNGNSVLHLAASNNQVQIVKYLLENTRIDVNALNSNGLTALEILGHIRRDSNVSQSSNGILSSSEQVAKHQSRKYKKLSISKNEKKASKLKKSESMLKKQTTWMEGQRSSIMIVASLIATMGFQAALTPPGGFWQDDGSGHEAGNSIFAMKEKDMYMRFMIANTVGFIFSLSVILFLVSGLPYKRKIFMWILMIIMWISISAMAYTYGFVVMLPLASTDEAFQTFGDILSNLIVGWVILMALLNAMHTIRLISHLMRRWNSKLRVVMWTLMIIICVSITSLLLHSVAGDMQDTDGQNDKPLIVLSAAIIAFLSLLAICGVVALVRGVHIIIMKLTICCRKIKSVLMISRNDDNIIMV